MKTTLLRFFLVISFLSLLVVGCSNEKTVGDKGGEYPSDKITYSIPFDPGGQSDIEARRQQPYLEEKLGQQVVIAYKPGGGGSIGWSELVQKKPDGYFISGMNIPHIILQPLSQKDSGYKTEEITPIAIVQATPIGLAVSKDSEIDSLQEFIEAAKKQPGSITVAGSGTYSGHHLAFLQVQELAGITMQYIPFNGAAPAVQGFLGNNTKAIMANSNDLMKYKDEMKILAIGSEKTFEPLPNVPTFQELGFDMTAAIDRGVAVPPGVSADKIAVLEAAFLEIANDPAVQEEQYKEGFEPKAMGHEESKKYIQKKKEQFREILEELDVVKE